MPVPDEPHHPDRAEAFRLLRGTGQPAALVYLAIEVASSADAVEGVLRVLAGREKPKTPLPPVPPLRDWLPLYRRHRVILAAMLQTEASEGETGAEVVGLMKALPRVSEEEWAAEVADSGEDELKALLSPFLGIPFPPDDATLRAILDDMHGSADDAATLESCLATPAGQFFARVFVPCWLLYREWPSLLLRRARGGDLDAIDKLLRLDKSAEHDPRVAEHVHRIQHSGSKRDRDRLTAARTGGIKTTLTPQSIRYGLAGLISQFAPAFGTKVTAPQIAKLFDRIETIRSGQTDRHVPAGEAFTKAISRNRTWSGVPRP